MCSRTEARWSLVGLFASGYPPRGDTQKHFRHSPITRSSKALPPQIDHRFGEEMPQASALMSGIIAGKKAGFKRL